MDSVKNFVIGVWDFLIYLIKSFLYLLSILILVSVLSGSDGELTFYALIIGVPTCLCFCWKPYRRKRLKRELDKTNQEISRSEKEVADLTVQKQRVMFDSISFIDQMEGHEFEHWCAALLLKLGFDSADVTQASGDDGVDIIAVKEGIRYAIQCKRYSSDLGNTPVQEVNAGKDVYKCHIGAVMTNVYFTAGGKRTAEATGTLLWDRDWISEKLLKVKSSPLVSDSLPSSTISAMDIIIKTQQASVSILERYMHIDYPEAAQIIQELESLGYISHFNGLDPRSILISSAQWEHIKAK